MKPLLKFSSIVLQRLILIDFLLYMEAGNELAKLVKVPMITRFTFDFLVRNKNKKEVDTSHNAVGPFQITNPFLFDYLEKGDQEAALEVLHLLVNVNESFVNIPVYQIKTVLGFLSNYKFDIDEIDEEWDQSTIVESLDFIGFSRLNHSLTEMYTKYYGTMTPSVRSRIHTYCDDYPWANTLFVFSFTSMELWTDV